MSTLLISNKDNYQLFAVWYSALSARYGKYLG